MYQIAWKTKIAALNNRKDALRGQASAERKDLNDPVAEQMNKIIARMEPIQTKLENSKKRLHEIRKIIEAAGRK